MLPATNRGAAPVALHTCTFLSLCGKRQLQHHCLIAAKNLGDKGETKEEK